MAQQPVRVNPGDLITAEFMNLILERLDILEEQVANVVINEDLVINFPFPEAQLHLGDTLTITGKGFGVPSSNTVSIDGQVQTILPGGSSSKLMVKIQNIQIIGDSKVVTLIVSNPTNGDDSTQFILLPFVPDLPTAALTVFMSQPPPEPKIIGRPTPYLFIFKVDAISNMEEEYDLIASVVGQSWTATPVTAQDNPLPKITIPKSDPPNGTTRDVRVNLIIPAGTPDNAVGTLKLEVVSKKNPTNQAKGSGTTLITTNAAPPVGMDKVVASFRNQVLGNATLKNDGVVEIVKNNLAGILGFKAVVKQKGAHTVTVSFASGNGWTSTPVGGFTAPEGTTEGHTHEHIFNVSIKATTGGPAVETDLIVKVALASDPNNIFGEAKQKVRPVNP